MRQVVLEPPRTFREYRRRYERLLSIAASEGIVGGDPATLRQRPDYVRCAAELRIYEKQASLPLKALVVIYLCARSRRRSS